jgi:hypothetical protein
MTLKLKYIPEPELRTPNLNMSKLEIEAPRFGAHLELAVGVDTHLAGGW